MAEHCLYSNFIDDSSNLIDCDSTHECHHCYDCIDSIRCSSSFSLLRCEDCSFSSKLTDSFGCEYCFDSINLRNKKFFFKNKQYSQGEWKKLMKEEL